MPAPGWDELEDSLELHPDALAFDDAAALRSKLKASLDFCREHLRAASFTSLGAAAELGEGGLIG